MSHGPSDQSPIEKRPFKGSAEIISPLKVHGESKDRKAGDSRFSSLTIFLILGLILVLILVSGGWLLHYLSQDPLIATKPSAPVTETSEPKTQPPVRATADTEETSPAAIEPNETVIPKKPDVTVGQKERPQIDDQKKQAELSAQKEQAEQKLADFIKIKNLLDSKDVSKWGGDLFVEMTKLNQAADTSFLDEDYPAATKHYETAAAVAGRLRDQQETVFKQLMDEGRSALEAGDGKVAQEKFSIALMIDPTNSEAQWNLKRARNIEAVIGLMASGKAHEQNNDLNAARADYQAALKLDPAYSEAAKSLEQVKARIAEQAFREYMSEGLAAFHKKDYSRARSSLLKAKSIKPQSREVLEALTDVDNAARLDQIEKHRRSAAAAEDSEQWQQALKAYLAVLEIDGNVNFAIEGKARATHQIRVRKRIQFFMDNPSTLESDRQLDNAILLVREVEELESIGPRLNSSLQKLKKLIQLAQTPIRVTLESDTLTNVVIYKVARLGRFAVRELELRPGTYTIVGSRDGYQDVRAKLVIKPGQKSLHVSIICKVKV